MAASSHHGDGVLSLVLSCVGEAGFFGERGVGTNFKIRGVV